ncbi:MAG: hypothetical protein KatS3mg029_0564 [Saprospiraceae bacterium]|nr:MAG: hypothetical protein KatS3mg029_0564 [Saprospiraceae bacterium]
MRNYNTLVECIEDLRKRGYVHDFHLQASCIRCNEKDIDLKPDTFEIVEVHRFEGFSDPDDNAVIYAVESKDGLKGLIVDAYGPYAQELDFEMAEKLRRAPKATS